MGRSRKFLSLFVYQSKIRPGWSLLLFVALFVLLDYASFVLLPLPRWRSYRLSPNVQIIDEIRLFLVVLCSTAIMGRIERRNVWSYGLGGPYAMRRFGLGAFCGLIFVSLLVGSLVEMRYLVVEPNTSDLGTIVLLGIEWAVAFIFLAATEETLFRGYLQTTLARVIGFWPAAVSLSMLFGAAHLTNRVDVWFHVVSAFMVGLVFSLALRESGSLWWGIGFHAAWDWAQAFLYGTPAGGHVLEGRFLHTVPNGDPNWSGGTAGPDASFAVAPVLAVTALIIALSFKRIRILRRPPSDA